VEPDDLNLAVSLFFVTFVTLQPFSAAVGRQIGAKHWIPIIMLGWGVCTIAQAWTNSKATLITIRLLIGTFEAGFYPSAVFYLSIYYTKFDFAVRVALFYGQYAIAGAFGGSIAYGVFHIRGSSLRGWQWLFVIEGIATCVIAIIAWISLPSGPESAWFLTVEERRYSTLRMRNEAGASADDATNHRGVEPTRLTSRDWIETGKDWKLWYVRRTIWFTSINC
jgi:MFS family permease